MTQAEFIAEQDRDIAAYERMPYDRDYGSYHGHPMDPRTPEREWADLERAEKLERYNELSRSALVTLLLEADVEPDA